MLLWKQQAHQSEETTIEHSIEIDSFRSPIDRTIHDQLGESMTGKIEPEPPP